MSEVIGSHGILEVIFGQSPFLESCHPGIIDQNIESIFRLQDFLHKLSNRAQLAQVAVLGKHLLVSRRCLDVVCEMRMDSLIYLIQICIQKEETAVG